jgi:ligand-binding sensor domain-containing protein/signal transduction histidine kinase/DNA-binding response OmpR family regulator
MKLNKRILKLLSFSFLVLSQLTSYAQKNIHFRNLTIENGLSQNSVMAITQDRQQFLWFGTKHGLNRYDGHQFKVYRNIPNVAGSISSNEIQCIYTDAQGVLWVGTMNGLNKYDRQKDAFTRIPLASGIGNSSIEFIYEDRQQRLWIGTLKGLYLLTDRKQHQFKPYFFSDEVQDRRLNVVVAIAVDQKNAIWVATTAGLIRMTINNGKSNYRVFKHEANKSNSISSNYVTSLAIDAAQNLWIGTDNGINLFNYADESFTTYTHNKSRNSIVHNDIREIVPDKKGMLWIGTQEGLSIFDPKRNEFSNYQYDPEVKNGINQNSIHSIFQDVNGTMWIGTYYGGVNFTYPYSTEFKVQQNSRFQSSISSNVVSSIVEDEHRNLWIGTEGGGLNYFDRKNNTYTHYKNNPKDSTSLTSNLIKTVYRDRDGDLIIGTHHGGLNVFDPSTKSFKHILNVKDHKNGTGLSEIIVVKEDSYGNIWIGSQDGLNLLKKSHGKFASRTVKSPLQEKLRSANIRVVFEDQGKNLWIGTGAGLYAYQPESKKIRYFLKNPADSNRLQSDYINCIIQSSKSEIWIGTYFGGISRYNPKNNSFKTYTEKNGLSNNNVLGIVEDLYGNLWISTDNGLSRLDLKTQKFKNYTRSDGLAANEFNVRSFFKDRSGDIYFGGYNGFTSFNPSQIEVNNYVAPIVFTGLKLFNQPVEVNGKDQLLSQDISSTKKITFNHDQNHFTLEFALLNYVKSDKNKYAYQLVDYDKTWNYTNSASATYTNLPSGDYTFIVKGINNDGIPGVAPATINIRIKPALWASWWAYCLYLLVFVVILFLTIRYIVLRTLLKRSVDLQQMKLSFFTNISHEIRTPLTLILGPLENLLKNTQDNMEIHRQVIPIKNNADRLMRLITELMDFRKVEAGHLKLTVSRENIVTFSKEIFLAFGHIAISRNIQYTFECTAESILLYFDKGQLEKVLFNLLSNAFKFSDNEGQVSLSILEHPNFVTLKVRDNGKGIPYESQNKLFSDFFQVDAHGSSHIGSGIGLALSKSIVESHRGKIGIESHPAMAGKTGDTCFTVTLQKGKTHFKPAELMETIGYDLPSEGQAPGPLNYDQPSAEETNTELHETILVVEDNPEIRQLISGLLSKNYQVKESEDGLKGWETAIELLPDLIICDIMMPVMDGLELCRKLKGDERTSHIPVILLTARSTHIHQVSGLETGADAYITKPFSTELLELNIKNLLNSRTTMRQKYGQQVTLQPQNVVIGSMDQAFMTRVLKYIEENMSDQSFAVPDLATEVGMSQPVLYKKIRAITDLSVNDFIKSIRLKKAAQLLEQDRYTISEISYLVGFNDPKYFSREFRKQYGETPRGFINNLKENKA